MDSFNFGFDNSWLQKYFSFIESVKKQEIGENHHIYPKSIFGDNNHIIKLSVLDHLKAHWYLYKAYKEQIISNITTNKSHFRAMCFALSSFNQVTDHRRRRLSLLTEDELNEYGVLIANSRQANSDANKGDLNLAKLPENRKKISDARKGKPFPGDINKLKESLRKFHASNEGKILRDRLSKERKGVPVSDERRAKIIQITSTDEFRQKISKKNKERNADPIWYNKTYTDEFRKRVSERFIGKSKSEDQRNKISVGLSRWIEENKEVHQEKMLKLNRDANKVAKTAEWHTGRKRSLETRKKQSEKKLAFIQKNGGPSNKGTKHYYNPNNIKETIICMPGLEPAGWVRGNPKMFGTCLFIDPISGNRVRYKREEAPKGWKLWNPKKKY